MLFHSRQAGSRHLAVLAVPLFTLLALSGCLGGDGDVAPAGDSTGDCAEGDGILEIQILPGSGNPDSTAWYEPAAPDLDGIHTICWVNDDDMFHKIIGAPATVETTPEWVLEAMAAAGKSGGGGGHDHGGGGHGDGHGGHGDHGGGGHSGPTLFDIEVDAGGRLAMPIAGLPERVDVHCHPHPWMTATWETLPAKDLSYATEIGRVVYQGEKTGDTAHTESSETTFDITAPNLRTVRATLDWDDAEDDQQGQGTTFNKADKFRLELKDPSGEIVASQEKSGRKGPIPLEYEIPLEWPEKVKARGLAAASAKLAETVPADTTQAGTWTAVVTLIYASDVISNDEAKGNAPSPLDGHQTWTLTIEADHEFAKVLPNGREHAILNTPVAVLPLE